METLVLFHFFFNSAIQFLTALALSWASRNTARLSIPELERVEMALTLPFVLIQSSHEINALAKRSSRVMSLIGDNSRPLFESLATIRRG